MDSILDSVKSTLGINPEYTYFDDTLILHINSVFSILAQLGVGPSDGYSITGKDNKWTDYISENPKMDLVKSYIGLKVRLLFDPPLSSSVMDSINRMISEMEWRLNVEAENEGGNS